MLGPLYEVSSGYVSKPATRTLLTILIQEK